MEESNERKAIARLSDYIIDIDKLNSIEDFFRWHKSVFSTLLNFYQVEDERIYGFKDFKTALVRSRTDVQLLQSKNEASYYLERLIDDINEFGVVFRAELEANANSSANVENNFSIGDIKLDNSSTMNQEQSQSQSQDVKIVLKTIFEAVDNELNGAQRRELKEIIESDLEPTEKKKTFVERIKSFGSDVASNILAGILLNPEVASQIVGLM